MPALTTLLRELTADLDQSFALEDGLYRLHFALRNPAVGRGRGLDGVEDDWIIRAYAEGLERVRRLLVSWGWPEPPRAAGALVPVWVFRTDRLGQGDCPLTIPFQHPGQKYTSEIALRSTFDTPRPEDRLERAKIEAAHEATHSFTHQYASPATVLGSLWAWFDEATAVFMEAEAFPESAEARRFGLYWGHCPEWELTTWGGYGGYFAAWFVRYLVDRFDRPILHEVWSKAAGQLSPVQALQMVLAARGTTFQDVFWDYCCAASSASGIDPGLAECFGPRSLTESFRVPTGQGAPVALGPLSCRYFRVLWDEATEVTPVHLHVEGTERLYPEELRAEVLTVVGERVTRRQPLQALGDGEWAGELKRPEENAHQLLVVGRIAPPERVRMPPRPSVTLRVTLGAAVPGSVYRSLDVGGTTVPLPTDVLDTTDYTFLAAPEGEEPPRRLTVLAAAPGEGRPAAALAADYRERVEAGAEGINVRPLEIPEVPAAVALECDFVEQGKPWKERVAFLTLEDGSTLQVAVSAPASSEEAEQWFRHTVHGARPRSTAVRLRPSGVPQTPKSMERLPYPVIDWNIGNVTVPVPTGLQAPPALALQAADGQFGLDVPLQGEGWRARDAGGAGFQEGPTVEGWAASGAESRLADARRQLETALRAAGAPAKGME